MRQSPRALAAPLCCLLPACSFFAAERQEVTIQAVDPATRILVDGAEVGVGSAKLELARDRSHIVVFQKDGAQDYRVIDHTWSLVGKLDAIGSIVLLFPGIGLLFPGARQLEPRTISDAPLAPADSAGMSPHP